MDHYLPDNLKTTIESISEMISLEVDSMYELSLTQGFYHSIKTSEFLSGIFRSAGDSNQFLAKVLTEKPFLQEADRYNGFHLNTKFTGKIYGKYIELEAAGQSMNMLFIYYKATSETAYALFYRAGEESEITRFRQAPNPEAGALKKNFLYTMAVNLDEDTCYDFYIAEIIQPAPLNMKLSFAEWRRSLSPCILEEHLSIFLTNTDPALLRQMLMTFNRHSYTVQMHLLDGRIHWTRHIFVRILSEKEEGLRFICTVQDIDDVYALVAQNVKSAASGVRFAAAGTLAAGSSYDAAGHPQTGGSGAQSKAAHSPFSDLILEHIAAEMQEKYMYKLSLKEFAGKYYLNTAYLGQLFIHKYGVSFHEYLTQVRMEKAAVLLTSTSYPISRIAEMCGIPNNTYFHRRFRKHFGCTPMEYRSAKRQ